MRTRKTLAHISAYKDYARDHVLHHHCTTRIIDIYTRTQFLGVDEAAALVQQLGEEHGGLFARVALGALGEGLVDLGARSSVAGARHRCRELRLAYRRGVHDGQEARRRQEREYWQEWLHPRVMLRMVEALEKKVIVFFYDLAKILAWMGIV